MGEAVGAVCLPKDDECQGAVHLPVFSLEVVKEGCIGEGLDNDESEDGQCSLHVAEDEPKRWVLGGRRPQLELITRQLFVMEADPVVDIMLLNASGRSMMW